MSKTTTVWLIEYPGGHALWMGLVDGKPRPVAARDATWFARQQDAEAVLEVLVQRGLTARHHVAVTEHVFLNREIGEPNRA